MSTPDNHLSGTITKILARSPATGWAVLEVEVAGQSQPVPVVGNLAHLDEGLCVELDGTWSKHRVYGTQFKAHTVRAFPPVGAAGIERFLRSGAVEGIGPVFARKIVSCFGDDTLHVIENDRWRLKGLKGVGPKRVKAVAEGLKAYRGRVEVMSFLHGQLGPVRAQRVYEKYGDEAREIIAKDPYRLIRDFEGFGFAIADRVARDVGVTLDHPARLNAAVLHTLQEAASAGHTSVPVSTCQERLGALLSDRRLAEMAAGTPNEHDRWHETTSGGVAYFELKGFRHLEERLIDSLNRLQSSRPRVPPIDAELAIPWAEARTSLTFAAGQRAAIATVLEHSVCVITGGPGTGKTTILNALLRILAAKGVRLALAAPTGRAARHMTESTGLPAQTIHKLLEYRPRHGGFARHRANPIETDVLVVDEVSMLDLRLARSLFEAMPSGGKLVLVGDQDQLPSVGAGQVLADLIDSGTVPVASLSQPFRQARGSTIITNAHLINAGIVPALEESGREFRFVATRNAQETSAVVLETVCECLAGEGFDVRNEVMCLSPMHRGDAGVDALNLALQARINPSPADALDRGSRRFGLGDKVIQQRNNSELLVNNGDIGVVQAIDRELKILAVSFDGRRVEYPFRELSSLSLAYCTTVHKSQGSEYPVVVVVVDMMCSALLNRKLLYTAVTRAKSNVVLVGQARAVHIAVSEARSHVRHTQLGARLRARNAESKAPQAASA